MRLLASPTVAPQQRHDSGSVMMAICLAAIYPPYYNVLHYHMTSWGSKFHSLLNYVPCEEALPFTCPESPTI